MRHIRKSAWLMIIPLGYALFAYITIGHGFAYTQWSVRDLIRAADILNSFPVTGAELDCGWGMRLPGGAQYLLAAAPMLFSRSPAAVFYFTVLLNVLSALMLFFLVRRYWNAYAAAAACTAYLTSNVFFLSVSQLWNPAFLPVFVICAYASACRLFIDGQLRQAKWFCLALAFGAQMHMSAFLLLGGFTLCLLPCLARRNPVEPGVSVKKELLLCLLFFILPFAPYIIYELAAGLPNTRLLLRQDMLCDASCRPAQSAAAALLQTMSRMAGLFVSFRPSSVSALSLLKTVWANTDLALAGLFLFLAGISAARKRRELSGLDLGRAGTLILFTAGTALALALFHAGYGHQRLLPARATRYVLILLPGLSIMAGLGAAAAAGLWRRIAPGRESVAHLLLAACLCGQVSHSEAVLGRMPDAELSYGELRLRADAVREFTGWNAKEAAGRVLFLVWSLDYGWTWAPLLDFSSYELFCRGGHFPGSGPTPGLISLMHADGVLAEELNNPDITDARFAPAFLGRELKGFHIMDKRLADRDIMVLYTYDGGRALASMTTRYVLTAEEKVIAAYYGKLDVGQARRLPGTDRFVFNAGHMLYGMASVNIRPGSDGARIESALHSNQLRGPSFNDGALRDTILFRPRLVLAPTDGKGQKKELVFAEDYAGGTSGILAPLSAAAARIAPGSYSLVFAAERLAPNPAHKPLPALDRSALRVKLGTLTVPAET